MPLCRTACIALATAGLAAAQSNTIPGLDAQLLDIEHPRYFGRRGAAHPDGEIAIAYSYYMCNTGSAPIDWAGPYNGPARMAAAHPFWSFLVARELGGRMVQVSSADTFVKHATSAANSTSFCGGGCQPSGTNSILGTGCGDAYSQNTNANRFWLGPAAEIDPWLAVWNPVGSYFDRGDPEAPFPLGQDGVRSLTSSQVALFDDVKNRIALREADLLAGGDFYYCMHMLVAGEAAANRPDNHGYRRMTPAWDAGTSSWTFSDAAPFAHGSVLQAWQGATVGASRNGDDDGHLFVGVKVSGPVNGLWHYEYAVHNLDNGRGAATLRIPLCPSTPASAVGFRDANQDPLDDWTWSHAGDELMFQASATNPLNWNQLFNFWFDCPVAPLAGMVTLDQARPGPGALSLGVGVPIPGGAALVEILGQGCGNPAPLLLADGEPTLANNAFQLRIYSTPNAAVFLFYSGAQAALPLGSGCTQYLDPFSFGTLDCLLTDNVGTFAVPLPIPADVIFEGFDLYWQAAQLEIGGALLDAFNLSNGMRMRTACR